MLKGKKRICCLCATILLFLGMSVSGAIADSTFLHVHNATSVSNAFLSSAEQYIQETSVCTVDMLSRSFQNASINRNASIGKGQHRLCLSAFHVANFMQYLFYYQSSELKEDGQLFNCRSLIVDYIHLRDSGE